MANPVKAEPELIFIEESHQYFLGDRELLAVTRVLEIMGFTDFSKVPPERLEHARLRGDLVHQATHMHDLGASEADLRKFFATEGLEPDECMPYVRSWQTLKDESGIVLRRIEQRIFDEQYGYAGTFDRDLEWTTRKRGQRDIVADFKTSQPERWHGLQLAAYRRPLGKKYQRMGIYLQADGSIAKVREYDDPRDESRFLSAVDLAHCKLNWG